MSDSLPENSFSGILRVIKLTSGEEVIGLVSEAMPDKIAIKLPAKLENFMQKDADGNLIECIKLSNYLTNIRGQEIAIPRDVIIYMGQPALDLEKMYDVYFMNTGQGYSLVGKEEFLDNSIKCNGILLFDNIK